MTIPGADGRYWLRVFLVDHRDGSHEYLGQRPTDDLAIDSMVNTGHIIALLRQHPGIVGLDQDMVVDIGDGLVSALSRTGSLLDRRPEQKRTE